MITDTKIRRLFLISKFFLTFFILFFVVCKDACLFRSFRVARGCSLSVGRVLVVRVLLSCVVLQSYTRAYIRARTHIHARGFLDYKFLDITIIFRLHRNF